MDMAIPSGRSRLLRAVIAGGVLAGGWFIADLALSTQPAAAASQIDLIPGAETPIADLLDTVASIAPVVDPVVSTLDPVIDPVVSTVDATVAPLAPVTSPILEPIREVTQPVVDTVVSPVLDGAVDVLTPVLEPVLNPIDDVVRGVVPAVDAVVDDVVGSVPATATVLAATITQRGGILSGDGSPAVSIAFLGALVAGAASVAPFSPLGNGGRSPLAPDGGSSPSVSFLGEVLAWMPAANGSPVPASGALQHPHASPVFASDITPD